MQRAASSLRRSLGALLFRFNGNPILQNSQSWHASIELEAGCRFNSYATKCTDAPSGRALDSRTPEDGELKASKHNDQADNQNPQLLLRKQGTGAKLSAVDKRKFLINTLLDLKDSKESVYGTLDAWVAWEHNFPLPSLRQALLVLEKEEQWHRVVQVIKWMLSKGQGTTMGTYEQLIRALEKDNRAEEAHGIWVKKIGYDLHSVPWRFCELMISIYYRNNMLDRLVKLFEGLESYDRRPPSKRIVQRVADAYEMSGLLEKKDRVLEKYSDLFSASSNERFKKYRKGRRKNDKKQASSFSEVEAPDLAFFKDLPAQQSLTIPISTGKTYLNHWRSCVQSVLMPDSHSEEQGQNNNIGKEANENVEIDSRLSDSQSIGID